MNSDSSCPDPEPYRFHSGLPESDEDIVGFVAVVADILDDEGADIDPAHLHPSVRSVFETARAKMEMGNRDFITAFCRADPGNAIAEIAHSLDPHCRRALRPGVYWNLAEAIFRRERHHRATDFLNALQGIPSPRSAQRGIHHDGGGDVPHHRPARARSSLRSGRPRSRRTSRCSSRGGDSGDPDLADVREPHAVGHGAAGRIGTSVADGGGR